MAMSIHNQFCLNLYDIPKSAQNFDDMSGIQCKLYLTVCRMNVTSVNGKMVRHTVRYRLHWIPDVSPKF